MAKLLLLEDDSSLGYILSTYLELFNHEIQWVKSGEEAIQKVEKELFDLAILDIMLPGIDGFETAQRIKAINPEIPFIFLSAKALKVDQLKAFKLGAIDYITKPIDEEILSAKINALTRKKSTSNEEILINIGSYCFNGKLQELIHNKSKIQLTSKEADIIKLLVSHRNTLLERKKVLLQLWGQSDEFSRKSMDVFISKIRKYFAHDQRIKIRNVHGKGFIFEVPEN